MLCSNSSVRLVVSAPAVHFVHYFYGCCSWPYSGYTCSYALFRLASIRVNVYVGCVFLCVVLVDGNVGVYICTYDVCIYFMYVYKCACTYVCMYVCAYVISYICMNVFCIYVYVYVIPYVCMYLCMCIRLYVLCV